jgi:hypothetical protein
VINQVARRAVAPKLSAGGFSSAMSNATILAAPEGLLAYQQLQSIYLPATTEG